MSKKEPKKKDDALEEAIKEIREKFGNDSIMTLNEKPNVDVESISTHSIGLNYALGIGGLPRGRIVEIYGGESSGKTTLSLHVVAEAQKAGGVCAFIDAEHSMDPQYATKLGVKTEELLISQPNSGNEALNILESLIKTNKVSVIVVDSVAALVPQAELDGDVGATLMGAQARLMSQAMRMLTAVIAKSNTLVIFINRTRVNIGGYGDPTTTAGGKALKFYASVRIEVKKTSTIKKGDDPIGSRIRAKVVKNKVAAPFKVTEFDILYNEGISKLGDLIDVAVEQNIINKSGSWFSYKEERIGQGRDSVKAFLTGNEALAKQIDGEVRVKLGVSGVAPAVKPNDVEEKPAKEAKKAK